MGGGEGGDMEVPAAGGRGGKGIELPRCIFCSFVICYFYFPLFFLRATTSCFSVINDFFPYPVSRPPHLHPTLLRFRMYCAC